MRIIIEIIDMLLWIIIAANVFYVLFFALASLLPKPQVSTLRSSSTRLLPAGRNIPQTSARARLACYQRDARNLKHKTYLILFPAYKEDAVILHSVKTFLQQDYPKECYHVVVISDQMKQETNEQLSSLPITLLQPKVEKSSKAKALQFAMQQSAFADYVVILDADNVVAPNFLSELSQLVSLKEAIQCHRTAKNNDNDIAALDGLSEEINNSIFRKGHNRIGMSSALIGSGMCFNYEWFKENVMHLDSAVEDRELEALLMKQNIYIRYAEDIPVMDEKVSSSENFQRQRLRWMTGQVQAFIHMLPYIPKAIITGNINYIDKTIQQALIPRSILLVLTPILCIVATLTSTIFHLPSPIFHFKWWCLFIGLCIALFLATPKQMRRKSIFSKLISLLALVWKMIQNILKISHKNKEFIHTTHNK